MTCVTDSKINSDVHSPGATKLLLLQAQTGEAKKSRGSRDSSGSLINYVRYPSLLLRSHTHTCSLTHTAITLSLHVLCGILATVARMTSQHVPHLAMSCRSVRVEKQGVVE